MEIELVRISGGADVLCVDVPFASKHLEIPSYSNIRIFTVVR